MQHISIAWQKALRGRLGFAVMAMLLAFTSVVVSASDTNAVLIQVNQERAAVGLPALQLDSCLAAAANAHAADMANNNYFSHTGLNGSSPTDRANAAGYSGGVGENIAAGKSTASETMAQWLASSGHRANILNSDYQSIGIGYAYNANSTYGHYWVQVFGLSTTACSSGSTTGGSTTTTSTSNGTTTTSTSNGTTTTTTDGTITTAVDTLLNPFGTNDGRLNDGVVPALVYCHTNRIEVWRVDALGSGGVFSFNAPTNAVSSALNEAIGSGSNTLIGSNGNEALWALTSNEVQLQVQYAEGTYNYIFPSSACGSFSITATPAGSPDSSVSVPASTPGSSTAITTTALSGQVYVVQAGDNLFRIALNNGVDMNELAAFNGITDPTRIFVGQEIRFP